MTKCKCCGREHECDCIIYDPEVEVDTGLGNGDGTDDGGDPSDPAAQTSK